MRLEKMRKRKKTGRGNCAWNGALETCSRHGNEHYYLSKANFTLQIMTSVSCLTFTQPCYQVWPRVGDVVASRKQKLKKCPGIETENMWWWPNMYKKACGKTTRIWPTSHTYSATTTSGSSLLCPTQHLLPVYSKTPLPLHPLALRYPYL